MQFKNFLNNFFKPENKKLKNNIIVMFLIGVLLIVSGNTIFNSESTSDKPEVMQKTEESTVSKSTSNSAEENLEKRLESILGNIQGAGRVKVMVSISTGSEVSLAQEIKRETNGTIETSTQGEKKETTTENYENSIVLAENGKGVQEPLVLKETAPKVEGVLILCEGGDDITIKEAISKACQALFNVPAHKIEVLKMK